MSRQDRCVRLVNIDEVRRSVAAVAARVSRPRVFASGNGAVPWPLLDAVDTELPAYRLFMLNAPKGVPNRDGVELETPFVGAGMRGSSQLSYLPSRLSLVPQLVKTVAKPHIVLINVSAPRDGLLSLGTEVNIAPAAIETAFFNGGLVIAQINRSMPFTYGDGELHPDAVDLAVEIDAPVTELLTSLPDEQSRSVADQVAALV